MKKPLTGSSFFFFSLPTDPGWCLFVQTLRLCLMVLIHSDHIGLWLHCGAPSFQIFLYLGDKGDDGNSLNVYLPETKV